MASLTPRAFPDGTGIPMFGNPIPGTSGVSTRQIVRMESAGGLLVGRPRFGSVAMITAYAPGCTPNDIVIEETPADGNTLLRIIAPSCFQEKLVQATLFLRRVTFRVLFAKSDGRAWSDCRLRTISLPTLSKPDHSAIPLPAVVINNLGLTLLLEERTKEMAPAGLRLSWKANLRTRIGPATWHLFWPGVALVMFFLLSWSVHKTADLGRGS
jgi:hypothetical protein